MFNVNGFNATLVQNNRHTTADDYYDDQDKQEINIKVCPYEGNQAISFGEDTEPQAKGYFITKAGVDVEAGDELIIDNHRYSIIDVQDEWIWNKVANIVMAIK